METKNLRIDSIGLMDNEDVDLALGLRDAKIDEQLADHDIIILTNHRIIHLGNKGGQKAVVFASIQDIASVGIIQEGAGLRGYVWGFLAFLASVISWHLWDHPIGTTAGSVVLALIGVYLIIDHKLTVGRMKTIFSADATTIECHMDEDTSSKEIHDFVNRLFQLKELVQTVTESRKTTSPRLRKPRVFAPR